LTHGEEDCACGDLSDWLDWLDCSSVSATWLEFTVTNGRREFSKESIYDKSIHDGNEPKPNKPNPRTESNKQVQHIISSPNIGHRLRYGLWPRWKRCEPGSEAHRGRWCSQDIPLSPSTKAPSHQHSMESAAPNHQDEPKTLDCHHSLIKLQERNKHDPLRLHSLHAASSRTVTAPNLQYEPKILGCQHSMTN